MRNGLLMLVAVVVTLVFAGPARAADMPKAVAAGVEKAFPGSTTTSWSEVDEDGKAYFECKINTKDGKALVLQVSSEGKVFQIDEHPDPTIPGPVSTAFNAKFPNSTVNHANKSTRVADDGKATTTYEFFFADANAKHRHAMFQEDGTFIK
jgi:hypothetical protein